MNDKVDVNEDKIMKALDEQEKREKQKKAIPASSSKSKDAIDAAMSALDFLSKEAGQMFGPSGSVEIDSNGNVTLSDEERFLFRRQQR